MRAFTVVLLLLVVMIAGLAAGLLGRALFEAGASRASSEAKAAPTRPPDVAPRAKADTARGEVALDLSEDELARELNGNLAGRPLGSTPLGEAVVERFTVALRNGQIELGGSARLGGRNVPFTVVGTVSPSEGRPVARVSEARVSGAAMPEPARRQVEQTLQAEIDRRLARQPIRVRTVEIGGGQLRIIGAPAG